MEQALEHYIQAILASQEYTRYACIRDELREYPDLKKKVDVFREKTFELHKRDDAFDRMGDFEKEYEELLEQPLASEFLDAELAFCRMIQKNNDCIMRAIHFE